MNKIQEGIEQGKTEVANCTRNCSIEKGNASANADIAEVDEVNDGFHYGLLLLVIPLFLMFSAGKSSRITDY